MTIREITPPKTTPHPPSSDHPPATPPPLNPTSTFSFSQNPSPNPNPNPNSTPKSNATASVSSPRRPRFRAIRTPRRSAADRGLKLAELATAMESESGSGSDSPTRISGKDSIFGEEEKIGDEGLGELDLELGFDGENVGEPKIDLNFPASGCHEGIESVALDSDEEEEEAGSSGKRKSSEVFDVDSGKDASLFGENSGEMRRKASRRRDDDDVDTAGLDLFAAVAEETRAKETQEQFESRKRYRKQQADVKDLLDRFAAAMSLISAGAASAVKWEPRSQDRDLPVSKYWIPSLTELCLSDFPENPNALSLLRVVPDDLRHQLSNLLCDSRRMNADILELLLKDSPTEIRLRDCSWLTEEEFGICFQECDMTNLTVLQLDQCGRCLPNYVLNTTLARSANCLPDLVSLSLTGACRLSDDGFSAILSSVPALRSLNISQCSLLTSSSIDNLANSLGSVLLELYLNDCRGMDAIGILPALMKFEHLEVLSLAGIEKVSDGFIEAFITARGHNLKKLILTDCKDLTDSSVRVIAENCSALSALDLSNLRKLTDSSLGYLAYGCQAIQTLKFCHNEFSDEAIAAFLQISGKCLKELSLNNIKKVGDNTAISLARHSRSLNCLDLSWCRNLNDEALGLIVDSCLSLKVLKLFGCTQITEIFLSGHSNPDVKLIGVRMNPLLKYVRLPDSAP